MASHDRLDPTDYPDRDALVRGLVTGFGWPTAKVAGFFGLSGRHVGRIAGAGAETAIAAIPRKPAVLTLAEAKAMIRDYLRDPYMTAGDRQAAREWIAGQVQVNSCHVEES